MNLSALLDQPLADRDSQWEEKFFYALAHSHFKVLVEQAQKGPDGWPYLLVEATEDLADVATLEPAGKVLNWLADKGIGLVVNPMADTPDYVFTYGMIWNFKETGRFRQEAKSAHTGQVKFNAGQKVHAGPPSEEYLPNYVREILRSFFKDQKIAGMNVLVMGQPEGHYDFCFSLESLGSPPANEHRGILEAISWFLPEHYSLLLVSEKGLPPFSPL